MSTKQDKALEKETEKTLTRIATWAKQLGKDEMVLREQFNAIEKKITKSNPALTPAKLMKDARAQLRFELTDDTPGDVLKSTAVSFTFRQIFNGDSYGDACKDWAERHWTLANEVKMKGDPGEIAAATTVTIAEDGSEHVILNQDLTPTDHRQWAFGKSNPEFQKPGTVHPAHDYKRVIRAFAVPTVDVNTGKFIPVEVNIELYGQVAKDSEKIVFNGGLYEARFNFTDRETPLKDQPKPVTLRSASPTKIVEAVEPTKVDEKTGIGFQIFPPAGILTEYLSDDVPEIEIADIPDARKDGVYFGKVRGKYLTGKSSKKNFQTFISDSSLPLRDQPHVDGYSFVSMTCWGPDEENPLAGVPRGSTVMVIGGFQVGNFWDSKTKAEVDGIIRPSMNARVIHVLSKSDAE